MEVKEVERLLFMKTRTDHIQRTGDVNDHVAVDVILKFSPFRNLS